MTSFLGSHPLAWTDPALRKLRNTLNAAFYRDRDIDLILTDAEVPAARIAWQEPADEAAPGIPGSQEDDGMG
jgi:hypothetical protein